jgi:predicted DNA-binding antitoxin AbrB/MazE fold protein
MITVEAVYQNGVFKPVQPVDLTENQRVRLRVELVDPPDPEYMAKTIAWLEQMRKHRQGLFDKYGMFPDSTPDIRADRYRDL